MRSACGLCMKTRTRIASLSVALVIAGISIYAVAFAHDAGEETVKPVMSQKMPPDTGNLVRIATVNYGPGQVSKPHEHPGAIFAYVLEGSIVSQLEGQPERTYSKGESWYEPPLAHHLVSKNASDQAPAALLVFGVGKDTDPLKRPIGSSPLISEHYQ